MTRFPPLPEAILSDADKPAHKTARGLCEAAHGPSGQIFTWETQDQALVGPFPMALPRLLDYANKLLRSSNQSLNLPTVT